ncbi:DNA-binding protein [Phragmitibacter flavus]|uniref:DNA-binding protein n=1 Tax=Phragmitibacter flavus TaxID=2576071 RepID=A0A5R8KGU7_9BACT|nr:DNA-binding protein [Phragmitibacter flavus]TLD71533.1 DNA-binding protein [Phragmitibacter flavus]
MNRRILNWWRKEQQEDSGDSAEPWMLEPLTPIFLESEHKIYVSAIEDALRKDGVNNIALSGNYGVGKSSILQKVAENYRESVIMISLSTLAPIEKEKEANSQPHFITPVTNRIQQEIVKQMLYFVPAGKLTGSRFRRIEKFLFVREAVLALILALIVAGVFLITGWTEKISNVFRPEVEWGKWGHIAIFGCSAICAFSLRRVWHGKLHIKELSAGSASVTLDGNAESYFDQYLDEIVNFFDVSKCRIVIFEDIDRFENSHIFETLRSLNGLLNSSRTKREAIRFIYAVKDSIFDYDKLLFERRSRDIKVEKSDSAHAEAVRANRTKFFDLIIPVVPFITHRSARDHVVQIFKSIDHKIGADIIDLAVQFIPDMRLIKNVRNEFVVFRDRVIRDGGSGLNLSENELFAMMLYKSTHLTDFENIRFGKSKLDELYEASRKIVRIKRLENQQRISDLKDNLQRLDGIESKSQCLEQKLVLYIDRISKQLSVRNQRMNQFEFENATIKFGGTQISSEEAKSSDFWRRISVAPITHNLEIIQQHYHVGEIKLTLNREQLSEILQDSLKQEFWDKNLAEEMHKNLRMHEENLNFLRQSDMSDLIQRSEFTAAFNGTEEALDTVAAKLLESKMAFELVKRGYINRNFTLYTSTFHSDRVSAAAANFIMHHVAPNTMDEFFSLAAEDIKSLVRECGMQSLGDSAFFNISILDHLLQDNIELSKIMIRSIARFEDDAKRFLQAYLNEGAERHKFLKVLAQISSRILNFLIADVKLDLSTRIALTNTVLEHLNAEVDYDLNHDVIAFFKENYLRFPVLTDDKIETPVIDAVANLFEEVDVRFPLLMPLSKSCRKAFVDRNIFDVTMENLQLAIGGDLHPGLDIIRNVNPKTYKYVLDNLDAYSSAVEVSPPSIVKLSDFAIVINDICANGITYLDHMLACASPDCVIDDLNVAQKEAWPSIIEHGRLKPTLNNISEYISAIGKIDRSLGKFLNSIDSITIADDVEEEIKQGLANKILIARDKITSVSQRCKLVSSLQLKSYLRIEEIHEEGELFASLLKRGVIEDCAETYYHLMHSNWETREFFIMASNEFVKYLDSSLVQGDVAKILLSEKISVAVKQAVLNISDEYIHNCDEQTLLAVAEIASSLKVSVSSLVVETLSAHEVPPGQIVFLLADQLQQIEKERLLLILGNLGGEYKKLSDDSQKQPKLTDSPEHRALIQRLQSDEILGKVEEEGNSLRIYKRRR